MARKQLPLWIAEVVNSIPSDVQAALSILDMPIEDKLDMLAELHMSPTDRVNRPRAKFNGRSYRQEQQAALDAMDKAHDAHSGNVPDDVIKRVIAADQLVNRALRANAKYELAPDWQRAIDAYVEAMKADDADTARATLIETVSGRIAVKRREGKLSSVSFYESCLVLAQANYRVSDVARAAHKWSTQNGPASGAQAEIDAIMAEYAATVASAAPDVVTPADSLILDGATVTA